MFYKIIFYFFLSFFITPLAFGESEPTSAITENTYSKIIAVNGLMTTLALSPTLIDSEINKLSNKKLKLSKQELSEIKTIMLARFHPSIIEERLLLKLHDTDNTNALALLNFYQSDLATQIHSLRKAQLQPEHQTQLLEYQEKLLSQPAQGHRYKLITIFDKLNYQSQWQAALIQTIQESIHNTLPEKKRSHYHLATEQSIEQELAEFNRVINMHSLRLFPSDQLISYLDGLHNHKTTLELIDSLYHETLNEQKNSPLTLK